MRKFTFYLCLIFSIAMGLPAFAGTPCTESKIDNIKTAKATEIATQVYNYLEKSDAELAFIARAGQDLSKYGLSYSHAGIVIRNHPKGKWLVVHELNQCGTANSKIFDEGLVNFFMDNPYQYRSVVVIPSKTLQHRMLDFFNRYSTKRLHNPRYSMIAYPFGLSYQNSNQYVLATITANLEGFYGQPTPINVRNFLMSTRFRPSVISVTPIEKLGAGLFKANIAFNDHPYPEQRSGKFQIVSVDSVFNYLIQMDRINSYREFSL